MTTDIRRFGIVLDRLVHDSTQGDDLIQTVEGLRRLCKNVKPSSFMGNGHGDSSAELQHLKADYGIVMMELLNAKQEVHDLKKQLKQRPRVEALDPWISTLRPMLDAPDHDRYTTAELLEAVDAENIRANWRRLAKAMKSAGWSPTPHVPRDGKLHRGYKRFSS